MENFARINPILNPEPEDIRNYYEEHNIPAWDNPYFERLIGPMKENVEKPNSSYHEEVKFSFETPFEEINPTLSQYEEKPVEKRSEFVTNPNYNKPTSNKIIDEINNLNIDDNDKSYLVKLAKRESNYNPTVINRFGYQGLYQFGDLALKDIGFTRTDLNDTTKQHQAALALANKNEHRLKEILEKYENQTFKGVKITRNGIRAAAHLLGASTVKDWFNGTTNNKISKRGFVDGNGVHITEYLKMFD